jgi:two-component system chemotaxis response regulator CheY
VARIVVVDDEPDMRFIMRRLLEAAGHDVVTAGNGAAALVAVRERIPALVITDIMMPVLNGAELIRFLRAGADTAAVPILALTSDQDLARGADAVIDKPFAFGDLIVAIDKLLNRSEADLP